MNNAHGPTTVRIERGVYRRITHGKDEFGSRADDLSGKTTWIWGFPTLAKARQDYQARRATVRHTRDTAGQVRTTQATVEDLITEFLPTVAHLSAYREQKRFGEWWKQHFKKRPVLTLDAMAIRQAMVLLRKSGRSTGTVNHYVKFLRHMMRVMVRPKAWVIELWADVRLERPAPMTPHILTLEQEDRLLDALSVEDALRVGLATAIGIRLTQFFSLRWEWVSWNNRALALPPFKRHPGRTLPLPTIAMVILEQFWLTQGKPEQGWVFQAKGFRTRPVNAHNWYNRHYAVAVKKAGLSDLKVTFHTLRRTWASRTGQTTPARILQALGGWSNMQMAELYCQPFDEAMREAMERGAVQGSKKSVGKMSGEKTPIRKSIIKLLKNKDVAV
ncbi:MAG: tyrosine-type recombinase/integrase [Nitrospirota bacterium]|nr:tyrosine-type recombinase/integrase [Nitrospirota bacterium]